MGLLGQVMELVAAVLILALPAAQCSWSQQYGSGYSSSFVAVSDGTPFKNGASQTFQNFYNLDDGSYNPAVSEFGTLFLPLTQIGLGVSVAAIDTSGEVIWNRRLGGPSGCGQASNVVYSRMHGIIMIACGESYSNSTPISYSIFAIREFTGQIMWCRDDLNLGKNSKFLALSSDYDSTLAYFGESQEGQVCVVYLNISNGAVISSSDHWLCDIPWEGHMQSKTGYYFDKEVHGKEMLITSWSEKNTINAFRMTPKHTQLWNTKLPTNPMNGTHLHLGYAFTEFEQYSIFVSVSFVPWETNQKGDYYILQLDSSTGSVLYNRTGYCDNTSAIISSPAVSIESISYFSCGDQVFATNPHGELLWKSQMLTHTYRAGVPPLPVSLCYSKGQLHTVVDPTTVMVLQMDTGAVINMNRFALPKSAEIIHPPIVLSDIGLYILYRIEQEKIAVLLWSGP